jgi:membrane-associated protease RseP (regulator of RpoE activity)
MSTVTESETISEACVVKDDKSSKDELRRIEIFLIALVGLVGVLTIIGGWALPVVLAGVVTIIAGHELGHFLVAKRAGMKVTDFFIGFGPVVWSGTRGETRYGVRAFLLGGYVKVPGMTWEDEVAPEDEARTYRASTWPRKVLFACAGPLMNGVMALVLVWAMLVFVGWPAANHVGIAQLSSWNGTTSPAAKAGIQVGDRIVSLDGRVVTSGQMLSTFIRNHAGDPIKTEIQHNGKNIYTILTPIDGRSVKINGVPLATGNKPEGFIGVGLTVQLVTSNPAAAVPASLSRVGTTISASVSGIMHVFSPSEFSSLFHQVLTPSHVSAATKANRPESIVGIVRIAVQGSSSGAGVLLVILMSVNVFVGMFNLIPILPLDGGYVALATYERLRSRRGKRHHTDMRKLLPVVYAFVGVLVVLFMSTLYLDIVHPLTNPFH